MPIHRTYFDKNLTIFVVHDEATYEEVMVALEVLYVNHPTLNVLWDIRQGTMVKLPYEKLLEIAEYVSRFSDKRSGGKTALVTSKPVDYGIARIFNTLAEIKEVPFIHRVFYDYDEAIAWLRGEKQM